MKIVAAALTAAVAQGCASNAPVPSASDPTPDRDVLTYRGDSARTGIMPGPGPTGTPGVAWMTQAGGPIRSSPLVVGDLVVVLTTGGVLQAFRLADGTSLWSADLGTGTDGAPLVIGDRVIVGNDDGDLAAFDLASGHADWVVDLDGAITGSPAADHATLVTGTASGTAYALESATGAIRWSADLGAGVSKSVAIDQGTAYLGLGDGSVVALRVGDGTVTWRATVSATGVVGTPTAAGGLVFVATGLDGGEPSARTMTALDATDGHVRWRYGSPDGKQVYTAAVADGVAYVVGEDRRIVALDAATGGSHWSMTLGTPIDALPVISDDVVFVAPIDGPVAAIAASTGDVLWTVPIRGVPYAPTVARGYVLVGTALGELYAIGGSSR